MEGVCRIMASRVCGSSKVVGWGRAKPSLVCSSARSLPGRWQLPGTQINRIFLVE